MLDARKILFDNWGIKLISLGLSITLWFYVMSTGKMEVTLTVPLELRNVPQGMTVVGDVPGALEVRVQGQERELRDSTFEKKVNAYIDLSMTKEGDNTIRISPDDIKRPPGVSVAYLSLREIRVKLEPIVRRTYRLRAVLHGAPAPGHRVAGIIVTPPRIAVEGPASAMKKLLDLETMPIDIQGARQTVTVEPKIDYQGQSAKLLEKNITVRVNIIRVTP